MTSRCLIAVSDICMWWVLLNSPSAVDTFFTCSNRLRRTNDCFAGFDRDELSGVFTGDTLALALGGVVLLADITLVAPADIDSASPVVVDMSRCLRQFRKRDEDSRTPLISTANIAIVIVDIRIYGDRPSPVCCDIELT